MQEKAIQKKGKSAKDNELVKVTYYTDPVCCWSWAFEQPWKMFRDKYKDKIKYRYFMGGLIKDWSSYSDPLNSVNRPLQMGPVWMEARNTTGVHNNDSIWFKDPPASSYPACIAFITAEIQSPEAAEYLLYLLREAVMLKARNIARKEVIFDLAEIAEQKFQNDFSADLFKKEFDNNAGIERFRENLKEIAYNKIGRFPTITMQTEEKGILMTGYRPFEVLEKGFQCLFSQDKIPGKI